MSVHARRFRRSDAAPRGRLVGGEHHRADRLAVADHAVDDVVRAVELVLVALDQVAEAGLDRFADERLAGALVLDEEAALAVAALDPADAGPGLLARLARVLLGVDAVELVAPRADRDGRLAGRVDRGGRRDDAGKPDEVVE